MTSSSQDAVARNAAFQQALFALAPDHQRLSQEDFVGAVNGVLDSHARPIAGGRPVRWRLVELEGVPPEWASEVLTLRLDGAAILVTLRPITYRHGSLFEILRRSAVLLAIAGELSGDVTLHAEVGDAAYHAALGFCSYDPRVCLVPDPDFYATGGYATFRQHCRERLPDWEQRDARVFWRGSSTGMRRVQPPGEGAPDDLGWLQRLSLCRRAAEPDLAPLTDCGITTLAQMHEPWLVERVTAAGLLRPLVSREAFLQHRVVLDVDGNSNAWSGLFCSLLSRSCILKVGSEHGFRQWYYDQLVPWQTHVPVAPDLSDFAEAVQWTRQHEAATRGLADAAAALADTLDFDACMEAAVRRVARWLQTREPFRL